MSRKCPAPEGGRKSSASRRRRRRAHAPSRAGAGVATRKQEPGRARGGGWGGCAGAGAAAPGGGLVYPGEEVWEREIGTEGGPGRRDAVRRRRSPQGLAAITSAAAAAAASGSRGRRLSRRGAAAGTARRHPARLGRCPSSMGSPPQRWPLVSPPVSVLERGGLLPAPRPYLVRDPCSCG